MEHNFLSKYVRSQPAAFFVILVVSIVLIAPWGDFPLNDDWSYSRVVEGIVDEGVIDVPQGWASMTLMSVIAWGASFCGIFGFSHVMLRLSTFLAAAISVLLFDMVMRQNKVNDWHRAIGTATLVTCPLFINLSTTFMTDVPYLMFLLLSSVMAVRALRRRQLSDIVLFSVVLLVAMMARQFAALLAIAFWATYALSSGFKRSSVVLGAIPLLFCMSAFLVHQFFLFPVYGFPDLRSVYTAQAIDRFSESPHLVILYFARSVTGLIMTMGLYLLPVLLIRLRTVSDWFGGSATTRTLTASWLVLSAAVMIQGHKLMPMARNLVFDFGIGPIRLKDSLLFGNEVYSQAPLWFWGVVTFVSFIAGCGLIQLITSETSLLAKRVWSRELEEAEQFKTLALIYSILYTIVIIMIGYFDRFFLTLLPFVVLIASSSPTTSLESKKLAATVTILLAFLLFSVAGTHDYHAWNKARWAAIGYLTDEVGAKKEEIDGGFEYNGSMLYRRDYERIAGKSWWWIVDDKFAVTFSQLKGYTVTKEFPFETLLPWVRTNSIKILRRND